MATIGSLAVNIVATTDKFIAGLNNAQGRLGKFIKGIGVMQAAIVGAGAFAIKGFVDDAIEMAGELKGLTEKLHISAEAISALHYAAEQMESSAGAVDAGIAKLSVNLGKAAAGATAAQEAFSRIGLSYSELLRLPVEQQFLAVIDALHQIPDAAARAAAAQAIFGKGAKDMAALYTAGKDAIVAQGQAAADAGAIASTATVEALDQTGDAVTSLAATWGNLKIQMVAAFAPILDWLAWLSAQVLKVGRTVFGGIEVMLTIAITAIAKLISFVIDGINLLLPKSMELTNNMGAAAEGLLQHANKRAAEIGGIWTGGAANPLDQAGTKAVEKNTATTNDKLDDLIQATRAKGPQLSVAGVR